MLKRFLRLYSTEPSSRFPSLDMNYSVFTAEVTENTDEVARSYSLYTLSRERIEKIIREQLENTNSISPCMNTYLYEYENMGIDTTSKLKYYVTQSLPSYKVFTRYQDSRGTPNVFLDIKTIG